MRYLIFVNHFLFFHLFYCNNFVCFSISTDSYFSKSSSTDNFSWYKISYWYFCSLKSIIFWFFVKNFLFDKVFFLIRKFHLVHLSSKLIPCFFSFSLLKFCFCIFAFNICLSTCCFLFSTITCSPWLLWSPCSCSPSLCLSSCSNARCRWSFIGRICIRLSVQIRLHLWCYIFSGSSIYF